MSVQDTSIEGIKSMFASSDARAHRISLLGNDIKEPVILYYNEEDEAVFRLPGGIICTESVVDRYFNWKKSRLTTKTDGNGKTVLVENPDIMFEDTNMKKARNKNTHLIPKKKKRRKRI